MIRAVLFDLDRTLVDRDTSIHLFFQAQWQLCRTQCGYPGTRDAFVRRLIGRDQRGFGSKSEMYASVVRECSLPPAMAAVLEEDFRTRFAGMVVPFPGTAELLGRLRRRPYLIGVVTNGTEQVQRTKLATTGLAALVDVVLISETEGIRKPQREIFERALSRLGVGADEAVFVGDNLVVDVQGSRAAGMKAVWLADPGEVPSPEADVTLHGLRDLEEALLRLDRRPELSLTRP